MEKKTEETKQETISNWYESKEYDSKPENEQVRLPKFGITLRKGEIARTEEVLFIDDGHEINNQYGKSILFKINYRGADMVWFVKTKMFSLLVPIKKAMPISGKKALITRAGTTQADTRWGIKFPEQ